MKHYSHPRIIAALYRAYQQQMRQSFKDIPVNPNSADYLRAISKEPGINLVELADLLGVSAPAVTQVLATLEKSGLIVRKPDPKDGRVKNIFLSSEGKVIEGDINRTFEGLISQSRNALTAEENETLERLLTKLYKAVGTGSLGESLE